MKQIPQCVCSCVTSHHYHCQVLQWQSVHVCKYKVTFSKVGLTNFVQLSWSIFLCARNYCYMSLSLFFKDNKVHISCCNLLKPWAAGLCNSEGIAPDCVENASSVSSTMNGKVFFSDRKWLPPVQRLQEWHTALATLARGAHRPPSTDVLVCWLW